MHTGRQSWGLASCKVDPPGWVQSRGQLGCANRRGSPARRPEKLRVPEGETQALTPAQGARGGTQALTPALAEHPERPEVEAARSSPNSGLQGAGSQGGGRGPCCHLMSLGLFFFSSLNLFSKFWVKMCPPCNFSPAGRLGVGAKGEWQEKQETASIQVLSLAVLVAL